MGTRQRRQNLLSQQFVSKGAGAWHLEVRGSNHDDHSFLWKYIHLVAAGTVHGEAFEVMTSHMEGLQPLECGLIERATHSAETMRLPFQVPPSK
jgi:hypothetical protein